MSTPPSMQKARVIVSGSLAETSTAVGVLLGALDGLYPYVMRREGEPLVEGETHAAASVTVWNICTRLDAILANVELWDCSQRQRMEQAAEQLLLAQRDEALIRGQLCTVLQRPSSRMQPKLTLLAPGIWRASYGAGKNMLSGMGASPEKAMEAFDAAFAAILATEIEPEQKDETK